ncbi:hypothetical protein [Oceanobacillus sp. CFH 90083]|uniref:hypothetical protein n=1 Tax=Oceanobacillus sp. CFH 90083 TaxID=2592336 RepID=UPI001D145A69|nr:hypothetical protein [Oceanobacillus sp. CFH 90083]
MGEFADMCLESGMSQIWSEGLEVDSHISINPDYACLKITAGKSKKTDPYKTEAVLNRTTWIDGEGTIHELKGMDREHLQNILFFIYRKRDRYWLNCNNVSIIEKFKDGDEFFQLVIRRSNIWQAIINELQRPVEGFNFDFKVPGEEA